MTDRRYYAEMLAIGSQHFLSMFGATILVPLLTGLPVSTTLFASGLGTIIFHTVTQNKVPAYLGSSFAFIPPIMLVVSQYNIPLAMGGIFVAGVIYVLFGIVIDKINSEIILGLFPPVVTGSIIMVIGLMLAPVAIDQISSHVPLGLLTMALVISVSVFFKGFPSHIPIVIALVIAYLVSLVNGIVDTSVIAEASWLGYPDIYFPQFELQPIMLIAPVAIVTIIEHVGDVLAISHTVHEDDRLVISPGLSSTITGDGLATMFAGFVGAPPNTTYGENIGVLALTKVYDTKVIQVAACFAVLFSFVPKLSAVLQTIPEGILGGISIILFGMIAGVGIRTLVESNTDLRKTRNLIIVSVALVTGLGGAEVVLFGIEFSGLVIAAVSAIVLNKILPR